MATVRKFFHLGWRCSIFTVNCYSLGQKPIKCLSLNWFWSSPLEKRLFSQVYRVSMTRLPAISLFTNEDCHKRHEEQEALFPSFPLFCVATAVAFGFFLSYKSSVYAAGKDECSKLSLTDIRAQRKRKKAVHMEKMRILRASRENEPPSKQFFPISHVRFHCFFFFACLHCERFYDFVTLSLPFTIGKNICKLFQTHNFPC